MLFEYAVEPKAIGSSWATFLYLIEKFGADRGRIIAKFPKSWFKEVIDASSALKPVERLRFTELLNRAKEGKVVRSGRAYDPSLGTWLQNAVAQQAVAPFHAIIAEENPDAHPSVLTVGELDEEHPLMKTSHARDIERVGASLALAMEPIFRAARTILFVDPFFDLRKLGYWETLSACIGLLRPSPGASVCCEIHFRDHDKRPPAKIMAIEAHKKLAALLPIGVTVAFFCWREKSGGEDFHARYLLTDNGGINVEFGFEATGSHQTVPLTLLPSDLLSERISRFQPDAKIYDLVEPVFVIAAEGITWPSP